MPGMYGYPEYTQSKQERKPKLKKRAAISFPPSDTDMEMAPGQVEGNMAAMERSGELRDAVGGSALGSRTQDFLMLLASKGYLEPDELFEILAGEQGLPETLMSQRQGMRLEQPPRGSAERPAHDEEMRKLQALMKASGAG